MNPLKKFSSKILLKPTRNSVGDPRPLNLDVTAIHPAKSENTKSDSLQTHHSSSRSFRKCGLMLLLLVISTSKSKRNFNAGAHRQGTFLFLDKSCVGA